MHGTTFRALKVTSQVATSWAEFEVYGCFDVVLLLIIVIMCCGFAAELVTRILCLQ